jgi:glycosyltransferase involved in cell wall biosynthesis
MPDFLRSLDVLVVPSLWPENQPLTVLEALATNTPVLASRVDGIRELLTDEALLFDVNSAASLAARLAAWVKAPCAARLVAPVSTVDQMIERTLAVYGEVRQGGR